MDEGHIFTNKDCGSHALRVVWEYKKLLITQGS